MTIKASLNGPNRRSNKLAEVSYSPIDRGGKSKEKGDYDYEEEKVIRFRIRSLELLLGGDGDGDGDGDADLVASLGGRHRPIGNECLFDPRGPSGRALMRRHAELTAAAPLDALADPILVHFHDIPIFVLRCAPLEKKGASAPGGGGALATGVGGSGAVEDFDVMYLSEIHCHNHKVCGKVSQRC